MTTPEGPLFDPVFLKKLDHLALLSRKLKKGAARGEHRVHHKGLSQEFHDYRDYQPGDDLRYLDWHIYARLERLLIKLFSGEEDLTVHILLDSSGSMAYGNPRKIDYARRVAAALGYIAIANLDRVGVSSFSDGLKERLSPRRRRSHVFSLFHYLNGIEAKGTTSFNQSLTRYVREIRRPGLAIVISDLMDPEGWETGLQALLYRKFDVMVIHILAEEEINPKLEGPVKMIDMETRKEARLSLDPWSIDEYTRELEEYFGEIEDFCVRKGIEYLRAGNLIPLEDLILKYLRQGVYLH